ncbi:MAG: M28 family peptidase [Planctomycetota bacterium]
MRAVLGWAGVLTATLLGGTACSFQDPDRPLAAETGDVPDVPDLVGSSAEITAEDLELAVRVLSDDSMAGRDSGSVESLRAAHAIAAALEAAGLRPAGDDGFLHDAGLAGFQMSAVPELSFEAAGGAQVSAVHGADAEYRIGPPIDATLDLIVVRTAEDLPEVARADAALLFLVHGSAGFRLLEERGMSRGRGWGALLLRGPPSPGEPSTNPPRGLEPGGEGARPTTIRLRGTLLARASAGDFSRVRLLVPGGEKTPAVNVVGVLDGVGTPERPELADEAIVVTAHYDHIGTMATVGTVEHAPADAGGHADEHTDRIFNGADDDASGVAAVLELAAALAAGPPPARDVVFLLVTGEEIGLVGTFAYLDRPVVPLEQTVYNLNFEMVGRPDVAAGGPGKLWLTGFERANVGPAWVEAGLPIVADPHPDQHFFERSDNMAFVMRGIVGQSLSSFGLHDEYHTVRDEADTLDYAHMQAAVRAALPALRMLADGSIDPAWVEGGAPSGR